MNSLRWIVASMLVGLLATACGESTPPPGEEDVGDAEQALASSYTYTTYYKEAAKINEVGYCLTPSICSGSTLQCSGVKSIYRTIESQACH